MNLREYRNFNVWVVLALGINLVEGILFAGLNTSRLYVETLKRKTLLIGYLDTIVINDNFPDSTSTQRSVHLPEAFKAIRYHPGCRLVRAKFS